MNIKKYNPLAGKATGEYVYGILRKNIIRMHIEPGEKISEQELSKVLGVSRTPVRESFIKLAKEGVVYILPQRGTYIAKIDMHQVDEARFIRRNLEKAVFAEFLDILNETHIKIMEQNLLKQKQLLDLKGEWTAERYADFLELDDEFHKIPYVIVGREMTWQFIESINLNYQRVRTLSFSLEHKLNSVYDEHTSLIQCLKSKDANKLMQILEKHISNLDLEKSKVAELFPNYFQ